MQGAGALIGGLVAGALYEQSLPTLVATLAAAQLVALLLLTSVMGRATPAASSRA